MNLKIISLLLVGILPLLLTPAFSEDFDEILVETDSFEYNTGDALILTGFVPEKKMPIISISIYDPDNKILSANTVEIEDDDSFLKIFSLDSPFYDKQGLYTINSQYGKLKTETFFEISGSTQNEEPIVEIEPVAPEVVVLVTDKSTYYDEDFVIISGIVSSVEEPSVLIGIYDPFDVPAGFYFGDIDSNLEFSVSFMVKSGVNFKTEGTYSVVAFYGESENLVTFDFAESQGSDTEETETVPEESEKIIPEDTPDEKTNTDSNPEETTSIIPKIIEEIPQPTNKQQEPIIESKIIQKPEIKTETKESRKNLSVEDVELGILLNQIQLNCDKGDYLYSISYYDGMGPAMIRLCKYQESITHFDEALKDDPNNVEIISNKGVALAKLGYYAEALSYFDAALEIQSKFVPALNNKANVLTTTGNFEEAMNLYGLASSIDSTQKVSAYNFEKTKLQLEKYNSLNNIDHDAQSSITQAEPKESSATNTKISNQEPTGPNIFDEISSVFSSIGSIFSNVFAN